MGLMTLADSDSEMCDRTAHVSDQAVARGWVAEPNSQPNTTDTSSLLAENDILVSLGMTPRSEIGTAARRMSDHQIAVAAKIAVPRQRYRDGRTQLRNSKRANQSSLSGKSAGKSRDALRPRCSRANGR